MRKKLLIIIYILIFLIFAYIFIIKFDYVKEVFVNLYNNANKYVSVPTEISEYKREYNYLTYENKRDFVPYNKIELKDIFYTIVNNGWNDFWFYCPNKYPNCMEDVKELANDLEFISLLNNYVSPYNSFINFKTLISGENSIGLSRNFLYSEDEIRKISNEVNNILFELNIDKNNVSLDTIKKIHNYIIQNVEYDNNYIQTNVINISNKATGALFNKSAVCSGYADLFAIFMDELNIMNFKVSSENHVWNVIKFNDKWHHIDVTWDDDSNNNANIYNFFMIDTDKLYELDETEHTFNIDLYLELKK